MEIIYDDYNAKLIGGGIIGTITREASKNSLRHNFKIVITMEQERPKAKYDFRIRKLTPRECFRLMDVDEENIDKIQNAGISSTQQYKMAGNSIVVSCLVEIFRQMFRAQWQGDIPAEKPKAAEVTTKISGHSTNPRYVEQNLFGDEW